MDKQINKLDHCLLCLEVGKDMLDTIRAESTQWHELNIVKIIEKHFWSLNIQPSAWVCRLCWQVVEDFHKFYLRVQEAHMNFGKGKEECGDLDSSTVFSFQETEIQIDFAEDLIEPEIPANDLVVDDQADSVNIKLYCGKASVDPLERSHKVKKKRHTASVLTKHHLSADNAKVNKDSVVLGEHDLDISDDASDNRTSNSVESSARKRRRVNGKHHPNRKENDKFIAEHFEDMSCDLCQAPFKNFPEMQKHFTEHHNQRGYLVCCQRKFSDRTRLVDHLHCHLNPDHFKCKECGKTMSDRIKLGKHLLLVHRANDVVKQHNCDICGKSFREAYVLRTHRLIHLPDEEKKFHCSDCGKNYGSAYLLSQHRQVVHLKRFVKVCYICGKEINSSAEFKVHMNKHEGIPLPIINCDVCGLRLTSERGLKAHKATQHPVGGKQDHPCPFCGKISPTARALKKHVLTMHEKGHDHKCNLCDKAFRRADKLKEHIATHTGTPLYSCPWCPMMFNSNGNMHSHRQNKHPKEYLEQKLSKYNVS